MADFSKPTAQYVVRIKDTSGALQGELVDFWGLSYNKTVNAPGLLQLTLSGTHALLSSIGHRWQVEVWRRNPRFGLDWYRDFSGLYMAQERWFTDKRYWQLLVPGDPIILSMREVLWSAGTANRSKFTSDPAETIMKTLVDHNAGPNATAANGRERDGGITGLSIQADGANGNTLDWFCAWSNLLETLQKLADVGGGDFDLVKTGAAAWEFRWYTGQRGTDRTGNVIFSLGKGNMKNPHYKYDRIEEKTVAVVGGPGQETDRDITIRTSSDYSAANDIERFVNGSRYTSEAGRQAFGDAKLEDFRAREELVFDPVQVEGSIYGLDYCVGGDIGDLVTTRYDDVELTQKITGVTVALGQDGTESVDLELETQ